MPDLDGMTGDPAWRLPAALRVLAPEATKLWDEANTLAWLAFPPVLLDVLRLRIAALIGDEPGRRRRSAAARREGLTEAKVAVVDQYYNSPLFDALERIAVEFAEQCVLDVSGPTDGYLAQLREDFGGERLRAFVTAVYLTEFSARLDMVAGRLLGDEPTPSRPVEQPEHSRLLQSTQRELDDPSAAVLVTLRDYQAAVVRLRSLDPVLTELVRLRCARTHGCRICQTLRLADARVAGADDTITAKIDFYATSDLDDRVKLALRITDCMITDPQGLDQAIVDQARATFSPAELAELCLDISKWSTQKIQVALGTDGADALPVDASGVSYFEFDADGQVTGYRATVG